MDPEQKEETQEEQKDEGDVDLSSNPIEQAREIRDDLAGKIKEYKELKSVVETEQAKEILSGSTLAGVEPQKQKEETPEEYMNRVMSNDPDLIK